MAKCYLSLIFSCLYFSPSTENCSFTRQSGPELMLSAFRCSVVPSAWVNVMFLVGKSSSISSNTWTPISTCPVLVSVHPAFKTSTTNCKTATCQEKDCLVSLVASKLTAICFSLAESKLYYNCSVGILNSQSKHLETSPIFSYCSWWRRF